MYELALLFRDGNAFTGNKGLRSNLNIYIEHSNEVWNFGFKQYSLNAAAAMYEVQQSKGKSSLASATVPGVNCSYIPGVDIKKQPHAQCWVHRRHARRVYEISQVFGEVFGAEEVGKRIRPVYASWTLFPQQYFNDTLTWLQHLHGPVNKYIYAIAGYDLHEGWRDGVLHAHEGFCPTRCYIERSTLAPPRTSRTAMWRRRWRNFDRGRRTTQP